MAFTATFLRCLQALLDLRLDLPDESHVVSRATVGSLPWSPPPVGSRERDFVVRPAGSEGRILSHEAAYRPLLATESAFQCSLGGCLSQARGLGVKLGGLDAQ